MEEKLPERMSVEAWNDVWFRRIKPIEGDGRARMMVYQTMSGYAEYEGKFYKVTGWQPPDGKAYVTAVEVDEQVIPRKQACERTSRFGKRNACISTHKPDPVAYKPGDVWECPSCGTRYEREAHGWHWPPSDGIEYGVQRPIR